MKTPDKHFAQASRVKTPLAQALFLTLSMVSVLGIGSIYLGHIQSLDFCLGKTPVSPAPGWHWGYWPWQYQIQKEPLVVIPQDLQRGRSRLLAGGSLPVRGFDEDTH